ncbi:hypothetical protein VTO42DRAFT_338 [Malbranchea cinnamomea]
MSATASPPTRPSPQQHQNPPKRLVTAKDLYDRLGGAELVIFIPAVIALALAAGYNVTLVGSGLSRIDCIVSPPLVTVVVVVVVCYLLLLLHSSSIHRLITVNTLLPQLYVLINHRPGSNSPAPASFDSALLADKCAPIDCHPGRDGRHQRSLDLRCGADPRNERAQDRRRHDFEILDRRRIGALISGGLGVANVLENIRLAGGAPGCTVYNLVGYYYFLSFLVPYFPPSPLFLVSFLVVQSLRKFMELISHLPCHSATCIVQWFCVAQLMLGSFSSEREVADAMKAAQRHK